MFQSDHLINTLGIAMMVSRGLVAASFRRFVGSALADGELENCGLRLGNRLRLQRERGGKSV